MSANTKSAVNFRVRYFVPVGCAVEVCSEAKDNVQTSAAGESVRVVLTFQGTCFLVRVQDITIPALAVIGGIAVDAYVFAVMSHGTGVHTWNKPGLREGAVKDGGSMDTLATLRANMV